MTPHDPPRQIGRYVIEAEIARGGMGTVYRARDPRIDRPVALKVLHPLLAGDPVHGAELRARFVNEARAVGRLTHPTVVPVHDAGEDPELTLAWFAMELVEGHGLDAVLGRGLSPARILDIGDALAAALDEAHERGVVHRDLKPANILIDSEGRPRLIDFSVAHLADSSLTHPGALIGTPAYMAPEQLAGGLVGPAADLFALGMVLCEGLVGERPQRAASLAIVLPDPARLEALPITAREYAAILPCLERALALDPGARYATGRAMLADLRRSFEGVATDTADEPTLPGTTVAPATGRRRRAVWVGAAVLLVTLAVWGAAGRQPPDKAAVDSGLPPVADVAGSAPNPDPLAPDPPAGAPAAPSGTPANQPAATRPPGAPVVAKGHLRIRCKARQEGTLVVHVDGVEAFRGSTADMTPADASAQQPERLATVEVAAGSHRVGVSFLNPRKPGEGLHDELPGLVVASGSTVELAVDVGFWGGRIRLASSGATGAESKAP